jgi:hypothetical protein
MGSGLPQSRRRFLSHKSLDRRFRSVFNVSHKNRYKYNVRFGLRKKGFASEQVINKVHNAEVLLSQGYSEGEANRKLGITEQTYYRY